MKPKPKFDPVAAKVREDTARTEVMALAREKDLARLAKRKDVGKALVAAYLMGVRDGLNNERIEIEMRARQRYIASLLGNL